MSTAYLNTHAIEIIGAISGFFNIYLVARNNIWNYFFGILYVSLYTVVFFNAKLYADMSLQLFFLVMQFHGIYSWLYGGKEKSIKFITSASNNILLIAFFSSFSLFGLISFILQRYTDSTTVYADAFITALSLVAQWMMNNKWIEHWYLWIIINSVSILLYMSKGLYLTTGLYFTFLYICILGYGVWKKQSSTLIYN